MPIGAALQCPLRQWIRGYDARSRWLIETGWAMLVPGLLQPVDDARKTSRFHDPPCRPCGRSDRREPLRHTLTNALALTGVALILSLAPAGAQAPRPWLDPALLAAAKAEGTLTVYSSTNEQEGLPLFKIFE